MPESRRRAEATGATSTADESRPSDDDDTGLRVYITADQLNVLLDCPDPGPDPTGTVRQVIEAFRRLKLPEFPAPEELAELLTGCSPPGRPLTGKPLVTGYAAVPPVDGRLEWTRDYFAEGWQDPPQDRGFDFFARLDNRGVAAGEVLLKLLPPVTGEPGLNVFGARIAVGKPQKARMRCGKGVSQEEDPQGIIRFRAAVSGRVRLNDGTLAVDEVYVIRGNLGLAVGNVRHSGTLQVEGDIEQGATIDVQGDIVVHGMIEPCTITVGGNLQVAGGIVGHEDCRIALGGSLQARYVRDAVIDAIGDVTVAGEISHTLLRTLGRVAVPAGRIAGGSTIARGGITVGQAGAAGATGTELVAGFDYLLEPRVAGMEEQLAQYENRRFHARRLCDELNHADGPVDVAQGRRAALEAEIRESSRLAASLKVEIRTLIAESEAACQCEIVALQEVWSGTTIQLGHERMPVRASVRKPRLARLLEGRVRLLPLGEGNMPDDEQTG